MPLNDSQPVSISNLKSVTDNLNAAGSVTTDKLKDSSVTMEKLAQELAKAVAGVQDVEVVAQPLAALVVDVQIVALETALVHMETVVPHLVQIVALDALEDVVDVVLIAQELVKTVAKRLVQQHVSQIVQEPVLEI